MKNPCVVVCIDPSKSKTGMCIIDKNGVNPKLCHEITDMSPENILSLLKGVKEKYKDHDIYLAMEEWTISVRDGYNTNTIRVLERIGERWSCISTLLKFKVRKVTNQEWHSYFGIRANRAGAGTDTKFQSVDIVLKIYPDLPQKGVRVYGDLADAILIGKYFIDKHGVFDDA